MDLGEGFENGVKLLNLVPCCATIGSRGGFTTTGGVVLGSPSVEGSGLSKDISGIGVMGGTTVSSHCGCPELALSLLVG